MSRRGRIKRIRREKKQQDLDHRWKYTFREILFAIGLMHNELYTWWPND